MLNVTLHLFPHISFCFLVSLVGLRVWTYCVFLGFEPKPEFLNESRRLYDSEPAVVESLQQINEWVEDATNAKMPDFLSALPPNLLLMLINAVHFKGEMPPSSFNYPTSENGNNHIWSYNQCLFSWVVELCLWPLSTLPTGEWVARFDPRFTSRGVFYLDDKHMVDVEVMEDAKHPLSFFVDNELDAQVKYMFSPWIWHNQHSQYIQLPLVIMYEMFHFFLCR